MIKIVEKYKSYFGFKIKYAKIDVDLKIMLKYQKIYF